MTLKKNRPTIQDAKDYRIQKKPYMVSENDYFTRTEKRELLEEFINNFEKLLKNELPKARRLDLVILKCHIIIEYVLNKYIEFRCISKTDVSKERFTFSQKISLVHMFGNFSNPTIIPSIEVINKLRNKVAHTLEIDNNLIDDLIKINSPEDIDVKSLTDNEKAKSIKRITSSLCNFLIGTTISQIEFENL